MGEWNAERCVLHLYTTMSGNVGFVAPEAWMDMAMARGYAAIAVTDHGTTAAYEKMRQQAVHIGYTGKVICGMNGYVAENAFERRPFRCTILAKNEAGIETLQRLEQGAKRRRGHRPPILREELVRGRKDVLLGSRCEDGELQRSIMAGLPWDALVAQAQFYDFLEVQPMENSRYLVESGAVDCMETLRAWNRTILRLGRTCGLPVIATSDAYYIDSAEAPAYRAKLQALYYTFPGEPCQVHLRTTREMLDEFAYLGETEANELVIAAPQSIAAQCM